MKNVEDLISKACHTEFSGFRGLRQDLETKFAVIFHNYGLELTHVQDQYEKYKTGMVYKSPATVARGKYRLLGNLPSGSAGNMM